MGYYVVSDSEGATVATTWSAAQKEMAAGPGRSCRSFLNKSDAHQYKESLRFAAPPGPDEESIFVDGAADWRTKIGFGAVFFGEGDQRNEVRQLHAEPITSPRAEILAAIMGAELATKERPSVIFSDCELVCRGYREHFPSSWTNQDLFEILAKLCETKNCRIRRVAGHSGDAGNNRAHELCYTALRTARENHH